MLESMLCVGAVTSITDNGLVYEFEVYEDKLVLVLTGYTDDMRSEVTVPSYIYYNKQRLPVKWVADGAFEGCSKLVKMTLPESIISIGKCTFQDCKNVKSVKIPESITSIGESTFKDCKKLEEINIPESVEKIGKCAFFGCSCIQVPLTVNVEVIEDSCFMGCIAQKIVMGEKVKYIRECAFKNSRGCMFPPNVVSIGKNAYEDSGIGTADFPSTLRVIEDSAFYKAYNLVWNSMAEGCESIGNYAFAHSRLGKSQGNPVNIPNSVKTIGKCAFESSGMFALNFGTGIKHIGGRMFMHCYNLLSVIFPETLESIGDSAFYECDDLVYLNLPDNIKTIGEYAFAGCSMSEREVILPAGLTTVAPHAFADCAMNSVIIPNSVKSIGESAFGNCKYIGNLSIANSVTSIGKSAFSGCSNLETVNIPNSVASIGESAFEGCMNLKTANISNSVKSVGDKSFSGCAQLEKADIPNSVTELGESAFYNCPMLLSVNIPSRLQEIKPNTYYHSSRIRTLTIPASVTKIGAGAFHDGVRLLDIYNLSITPQPIDESVFPIYDSYNLITLHVPTGCKAAYQAADCWKTFNIVEEDLSGIKTPVVSQKDENAPYYDLWGREVIRPEKGGIYIRNGKKVLVK